MNETAHEIAQRDPRPHALSHSNSLLLHCGGETVTRADVGAVRTPSGSSTWFPMPHRDLLDEVLGQLDQGNFQIVHEAHGLSHDGARYFGTLTVARTLTDGDSNGDYGFVVGLRNSHDKSYPAGLVAGTRVFVCDNLCFSGEIRISRKHTRHAVRDLRSLTSRAVGQLGERFLGLGRRIEGYKALALRDADAHDIVIRAVDCRAITPSQVPSVLTNWRKPKHEDFLPRTGWSLFNAITEVHKAIGPHAALGRGQALHGLFDQRIGMN